MSNIIKIDKKDKKLLYYLSRDARMSHTQLSKLVGISKSIVKYRIDRLVKKGIITDFGCVVNLGALRHETFTILIRFNEDIYEQDGIKNYFKDHPNSNWAVTLSGGWDVFAEFAIKELKDMHKLTEEIIGNFEDKISSYKIFISKETLRVEHLIHEIYEDVEVEKIYPPQRTSSEFDIDDVDRSILFQLNKDSTKNVVTIAKEINSTTDIVKYRLKKLKDKGILIKCFAEINRRSIGYNDYLYIIKLRGGDSNLIKSLKNKIASLDNISYAFYDFLNASIVCTPTFRSNDDIDHLSRKIRQDFSKIIEHEDFYYIKEQIMFNLFPKGLIRKK